MLILKPTKVIMITIITLFASPVFSEVSSDITVTRTTKSDPIKVYLGGSFGNADYDVADNSDVGFSLFGGIKPWQSLGFEFAYVNLGETKSAGVTNTEFTLFRGGVIASHQYSTGQLKNGLSIYGQIGLATWDADSPVPNSGTDLYYGGGLIQSLGSSSSIRYAMDYYTFSGDTDDENVLFISIGFQLKLN